MSNVQCYTKNLISLGQMRLGQVCLICLRLDGSDSGGKARVRQEEVRAQPLFV